MQTENVIEKRILELLSEQILSTSEVAKRMNMRRDITSGYLEALRNQEKLEKIRVGRSNVYRTIRKDIDDVAVMLKKRAVPENY